MNSYLFTAPGERKGAMAPGAKGAACTRPKPRAPLGAAAAVSRPNPVQRHATESYVYIWGYKILSGLSLRFAIRNPKHF